MNEDAYEEFKKSQRDYLEEMFLQKHSKEFANHVWRSTNVDSDAEELIMEFIEEHRDEFEELAMDEFSDGE